jgi:hypothetical protein
MIVIGIQGYMVTIDRGIDIEIPRKEKDLRTQYVDKNQKVKIMEKIIGNIFISFNNFPILLFVIDPSSCFGITQAS